MTSDCTLTQIAEGRIWCAWSDGLGNGFFLTRLIANNISQIDYVLQLHQGPYPDAGHAECFIGVELVSKKFIFVISLLLRSFRYC